jgi:prolyl 4-hydroxylase
MPPSLAENTVDLFTVVAKVVHSYFGCVESLGCFRRCSYRMDSALSLTYKPKNQKAVPLAGISDHVFILEDILSEYECDTIIALAENAGFKIAGIYTDESGENTIIDASKRRSMRCILDSAEFADRLWKRIQHGIVQRLPIGLVAKRLNERLRILKYTDGDSFVMHRDGNYMTPDMSEISQYTVLVYLNDGYEGGFTTYYNTAGAAGVPVIPKKGSVVIQHQNCLHCVPPLISGTKYTLRTEVMYGAA